MIMKIIKLRFLGALHFICCPYKIFQISLNIVTVLRIHSTWLLQLLVLVQAGLQVPKPSVAFYS